MIRFFLTLFVFQLLIIESNSQMNFGKFPNDGEIFINKNPKPGEKDYKFVNINGTTWLAENLQAKTFNNGESIYFAKTDKEWKEAAVSNKPAWRFYNYDPKNGEIFGYEYNWYAVVDSRGIAPDGYIIPDKTDYENLVNHFGGWNVAAFKLKSKIGWGDFCLGGEQLVKCPNCSNWSAGYRKIVPCHKCKGNQTVKISTPIVKKSGNGNNFSGFSAIPTWIGLYSCDYDYGLMKPKSKNYLGQSVWWTRTPGDGDSKFAKALKIENTNNIYFENEFKYEGYSVRCYFGG